MPQIAKGSGIHPKGPYEAARILAIELPRDLDGTRRDSPFGPWLRIIFETSWGTVATMLSPAYVEGSDLWHLARRHFGVEMPETLNTDDLINDQVPIEIWHQREHGAVMAVAFIVPFDEV